MVGLGEQLVEQAVGLGLVIVAVASWSIAPSLVSRLSSRDPTLDPLSFNAWRMLFALLILLPLSLPYGFPLNVPWLDPIFELGIIVGGVLSTVTGDTAFVYAVSRIGASVAVPVSYLFVVWSALVDVILGFAPITVVLASILSITGVWLVEKGSRQRDVKGLLAALIASIVWTAGNYGYKAAVTIASSMQGGTLGGSIIVATVRAIYTIIVLAPVYRKWDVKRGLLETVGASLAGYVIGALAYIAALNLLPVSLVSIGLSLNPVIIQAMAAVIASERVNRRMVTGASLVSAGIALAYIIGYS